MKHADGKLVGMMFKCAFEYLVTSSLVYVQIRSSSALLTALHTLFLCHTSPYWLT